MLNNEEREREFEALKIRIPEVEDEENGLVRITQEQDGDHYTAIFIDKVKKLKLKQEIEVEIFRNMKIDILLPHLYKYFKFNETWIKTNWGYASLNRFISGLQPEQKLFLLLLKKKKRTEVDMERLLKKNMGRKISLQGLTSGISRRINNFPVDDRDEPLNHEDDKLFDKISEENQEWYVLRSPVKAILDELPEEIFGD